MSELDQMSEDCAHQHTGSCSDEYGKYLYVVCMDCRTILIESALGKKLREGCPGWEREPHTFHCKHCHHDADYHIRKLNERIWHLEHNVPMVQVGIF
jgi:hypothetical protein